MRKLRRKHTFLGIRKNAGNFSKDIFPEPGKFENIQKLSSTFKNLRKA